jgi:hypothetical protein
MRRTAIALLAAVLCLGVLAVPAAAIVDLGVSLSLNTDEPLEGSTITVTANVMDAGGLDPGEWANGTVTASVDGEELGTKNITFDNETGEMGYGFTWVPDGKGDATITVAINVTGDWNPDNDEDEETFEVKEASGVQAGEISGTALLIGAVSLLLFFGVIIASVLGIIPQDRLPVQPALLLTTFIIMGLAYIGSTQDDSVAHFNLTQLASTIIIHPITALIAGFLVAGALEAAGAFEAAADGLQRLESFKTKGSATPIFGIVGVVVLLTNLPTIIAMPCGRILAAALMPAALFFGVRVARSYQMPMLVPVVVFPFIVNAAASCGPSLIGGIGTIGEGLAALPPGSLSDAQQIGIILATGVCALVMRFVTASVPPDLAEEEEERLEAERREAEKAKEVFPDEKPAGGVKP